MDNNTKDFKKSSIGSQDQTKGSIKKKLESKSKVPFEIRKLIWTSVGWLLLYQQNKNSKNW